MKISAFAGLVVSLGFMFVRFLREGTLTDLSRLPALAAVLYAGAFAAASTDRGVRPASMLLLATMYQMFFVGLAFHELQFFALVLCSITPLFTVLLLGFRVGRRWLVAFLGVACALVAQSLSDRPLVEGHPGNGFLFNLALVLGLFNLAGFAVLYQSFIERLDALIEKQVAEITLLSRTDPLTNIYNRRALVELFEAELARCKRTRWRMTAGAELPTPRKPGAAPQKPFPKPLGRAEEHLGHISVLMIDIDHFKNINDQYGHRTGDAVLQALGATLRDKKLLRETDSPARYGGEEFIVLEPDTNTQGAFLSAERIRKQIEGITFDSETKGPFHVTISCGIAEYLPHHENIDEVIHEADQALYRAKQDGRNRSVVFGASTA